MSEPDSIDTQSLLLTWSETPWDTAIMGAPVLQIGHIELRGTGAAADFAEFEATRDALGARLVSCRLPHDRLRESMFLESRDFRFIEMAYAPEMDGLSARDLPEGGLAVGSASRDDLPDALAIAEHAFGSERFHVDPRLDPALGDLLQRDLEISYRLTDRQRDLGELLPVRQEDLFGVEQADGPDREGAGIAGDPALRRHLQADVVIAEELGPQAPLSNQVERRLRQGSTELQHLDQRGLALLSDHFRRAADSLVPEHGLQRDLGLSVVHQYVCSARTWSPRE